MYHRIRRNTKYQKDVKQEEGRRELGKHEAEGEDEGRVFILVVRARKAKRRRRRRRRTVWEG